jgi:hypothetical protein
MTKKMRLEHIIDAAVLPLNSLSTQEATIRHAASRQVESRTLEIVISADGDRVWINAPLCVFRADGIEQVVIRDDRVTPKEGPTDDTG